MSEASFADIQSEIANILESADDFTEEQQALAEEYLGDLAQAEADKIDAFASIRREYLDKMDAKRAEAQRLQAQARTIENKLRWLDSYYVQVMQTNNLKKVSGKAYDISLRKSQRVGFAVGLDINTLPDEFKKTTVKVEPIKTDIAKALKEGAEIEGCFLEDSFSLNVK